MTSTLLIYDIISLTLQTNLKPLSKATLKLPRANIEVHSDLKQKNQPCAIPIQRSPIDPVHTILMVFQSAILECTLVCTIVYTVGVCTPTDA